LWLVHSRSTRRRSLVSDSVGGSEANEAIALLAARNGLDLTLLGPYRTGESSGAHRVTDGAGRRYTLKFSMEHGVRNAAATTQQLREVGYPAPLYRYLDSLDADFWYALMEELPGKPARRLSAQHTDQLLSLIELQSGKAFLPLESPIVVETLLYGGDG
jgi:hypothetical protein